MMVSSPIHHDRELDQYDFKTLTRQHAPTCQRQCTLDQDDDMMVSSSAHHLRDWAGYMGTTHRPLSEFICPPNACLARCTTAMLMAHNVAQLDCEKAERYREGVDLSTALRGKTSSRFLTPPLPLPLRRRLSLSLSWTVAHERGQFRC